MAVIRDSQAAQFAQAEPVGGPRAQVASAGNKNPGSAVFDFNQRTPVDPSSGHSWQLDLLKTLVGSVGPYVPRIQENLQTNEYLRGQTAAAAGQVEDDLEANPLTGDWAIAGHRDFQNKLRMADAKAQFELDLPGLAAQGPEAAKAYFDQRREQLLPHLNSGSGKVAEALQGMLALDERAGMAKYGEERAKWITNNRVAANGALMQQSVASLANARKRAMVDNAGTDSYLKQIQSTAGDLVASVWLDDSMPRPAKIKQTQETLEYALANDEIGLYDYIANTPIPLPDGSRVPLSAHLPPNEWAKLADKRRLVDERTALFRNMESVQEMAVMEGQMKAGTYEGSWEDLTKKLQEKVALKQITGGEYRSALDNFIAMKGKSDNEALLAGAAVRGDLQTMYANGSDPSDALGKLVNSFAAKNGRPATPLLDQLDPLMMAGKNGTAGAYKEVATRLLPSMSQLLNPDGTISKQHADVFARVNAHLDSLEGDNLTAAKEGLLSGLPDAQQTTLLGIRSRMKDGLSFPQALTSQLEADRANAGLKAGERAAMAAGHKTKDLEAALAEYQPAGLLSRAWNSIKFLSPDATTKDILAPKISPWSNDQTVGRFAAQVKNEVQMEAYRMLTSNPGIQTADLVEKAAANVAGRTIPTEHGPLIMPAGKTPNQFFGLPENGATSTELSKALNTFLKPSQEGNRMAFNIAEGKIRYQEYAPDGSPTNKFGDLDAKSIKPIVEANRAERFNRSNEVYGTGRTTSVGNAAVTYSGQNSAAVAPGLMFEFRKNLVDNEGVRDRVYKDSLGNDTIGVGLTGKYMPRPGPDGKYSKESLDAAFHRASDDAANSGRRVAQAVGLPNDKNAFLLFSELAYQSGSSFADLPKYRPVIAALRAGAREQASKLFMQTPAYTVSGANRRKHYLNLLNNLG